MKTPKIKKFKLSELKAADYNPRVIDDDALEGLANSIERFGCVEPIVVNVKGGANTIVGGHQRLRALEQLGVKDAICVTVSCSKADEKLLNLTLNNPAIQGQFIADIGEYIEKLRSEMTEDDAVGLRISELQVELGCEHEKTGNVPDDDIPKKPKKAVTKTGDLWILGKHRLLCGDSTKAEDVERLMKKEKASLFATDPPYFVEYTGDDRCKKGKDWTGVYHEVNTKDAPSFIEKVYTLSFQITEKNTAMYMWYADKACNLVEPAIEKLKILIHQKIIWVKPCILLGFSYFPRRHETCLFMWRQSKKPIPIKGKANQYDTIWPVGYQRTGDPTTPEYYSDVWDLDYDGKKRPTRIEHPTIKPVEVFAIPMRIHTKAGDICYEPFSGSGTQIIAAEKLGRRCYAIEMQPLFVDVAIKRWEQWTGKKAVKQVKSKKAKVKKAPAASGI